MDFLHVIESKRQWVNRSNSDRIKIINKTIWIQTPFSTGILNRVERILTVDGDAAAPCMLVYGPSGVGKTAIVERMKHHRFLTSVNLLFMEYDKNSAKGFFPQLAKALDLPGAEIRASDSIIRKALALRGIKAIVVDDLHDIALAAQNVQKTNLAQIRSLVEGKNSISIIAFGIEGTAIALKSDSQLESRFTLVEFKPWGEDEDFVRFIETIESHLPLQRPSNLSDLKLRTYLREKSKGNTRTLLKIIRHAAIYAICKETEAITFPMIDLAISYPFGQQGWLI
jgi:replication-associated recombination protein RarA